MLLSGSLEDRRAQKHRWFATVLLEIEPRLRRLLVLLYGTSRSSECRDTEGARDHHVPESQFTCRFALTTLVAPVGSTNFGD